MKILITGGQGYLGSVFNKAFKDKYKIIALGSKELNITDTHQVYETIHKHKPDLVLHFAAKTETKFCNDHPELAEEINVQGAVNIAKACKQINAKLVFASTEQVYNGNTESAPYSEDITPIPNTTYGANKLKAEQLITSIIDELWILRFSWIFGLPEYQISPSENILYSTLYSLLHNQKINITKDEYRGMSYIYDIIYNIEKVFHIPYGTYNFSSNNSSSRHEIVQYICELLSSDENFHRLKNEVNNPYGARRELRMNTDKIARHGISFPSTKNSLKQCLQDFGYIK